MGIDQIPNDPLNEIIRSLHKSLSELDIEAETLEPEELKKMYRDGSLKPNETAIGIEYEDEAEAEAQVDKILSEMTNQLFEFEFLPIPGIRTGYIIIRRKLN